MKLLVILSYLKNWDFKKIWYFSICLYTCKIEKNLCNLWTICTTCMSSQHLNFRFFKALIKTDLPTTTIQDETNGLLKGSRLWGATCFIQPLDFEWVLSSHREIHHVSMVEPCVLETPSSFPHEFHYSTSPSFRWKSKAGGIVSVFKDEKIKIIWGI